MSIPSQPPRPPTVDLDAGLSRIREAIERNRNAQGPLLEQLMLDAGAQVLEHLSAKVSYERERKLRRRREREERRARRRREADAAAKPKGFVFAGAAAVLLVFALTNPQLWWLVFVAFGLAMGAASSFGRAAKLERTEAARLGSGSASSQPATAGGSSVPAAAAASAPAKAAAPADPKVGRIQRLCDKLLADVETGPALVREVVQHPKPTIEGFRQACLEIARREGELRAVLDAGDEARLVEEREALLTRLSSEQDGVVRERLSSALRALEQQLAHRAELATTASRLEAENTRILYTLESLHMQLLRARSGEHGSPEIGGKLRQSLEDLTIEVNAVAEALEWLEEPASAAKPGAAAAASRSRAGERH